MIYFILFIVSFVGTYFIKNIMIKKSLLASVNSRSSHTIPTPYGGGIAIAFTWFIGLIYLYFINDIDKSLFYALISGALICIVSFVDDIYEISPKVRLVCQSLTAMLGLYFLNGFQNIDFFIFSIENNILTNIFAFILIVWFINLYNFLDGINGYAGSEAVFLSLAAFIIFADNHFLILAVSCLGFLYWNFNKAQIFMGDVGSTLLGYTIGVFTIYYGNILNENFWIWIILFSLFWFDATITLARRKVNGDIISQAHKKHAYQRLTQANWTHRKVTLYAIAINLCLFAIVYYCENIFFSFIMAIILLIVLNILVDKKKDFNDI